MSMSVNLISIVILLFKCEFSLQTHSLKQILGCTLVWECGQPVGTVSYNEE
jgi:hypothetical protein